MREQELIRSRYYEGKIIAYEADNGLSFEVEEEPTFVNDGYTFTMWPGNFCHLHKSHKGRIGHLWLGDVDLIFKKDWMQPKTMTLANLGVFKEYRGNGYARMLIDEAVKQCKRLGFTAMKLGVTENNTLALGLYERYGFKEYDRTNGIILMYFEFKTNTNIHICK